MFPGHFAAGLAIRTVEPRAPTFGLMVGVGFIDLVFGVLVPFHIEGGSFSHFITPWSHSLAMSLPLPAARRSRDAGHVRRRHVPLGARPRLTPAGHAALALFAG
eukprot:gene12349-12436_t